MTHAPKSGTEQAWAALGGDPALLAHIATDGPGGRLLPARLPVMELARSAVAVCSLAAAELAARRTAGPVPRVRIDEGAVATAFTSERHLRIDGRAPTSFAPLSRFWRTADGWVRLLDELPAPGLAETGAEGSYDPERWLTETDSPLGRLRHAVPPVAFEGSPAGWSRPPGPLGADAAAWLTA